jgi:hypothetical protein
MESMTFTEQENPYNFEGQMEPEKLGQNIFEGLVTLPIHILPVILKYDDRIKCRNGIWIGQISKNDYRYVMLKTLPKMCCNVFFDFGNYLCPNNNMSWENVIDLPNEKKIRIHQYNMNSHIYFAPGLLRDPISKEDHNKNTNPIIFTFCHFNKIENYTFIKYTEDKCVLH